MSERQSLLESIATITADYRASEVAKPTPEHVDRWIGQFDAAVQVPMLREMAYVLERTYFSRPRVISFLTRLLKTEKITGAAPYMFWRSARFLDIQDAGNSQREMLALFNQQLERVYGFDIERCGENSDTFIYLDDAFFTGNRVRRDLESWIWSDAPAQAKLHVITIVSHTNGWWYAKQHTKMTAKAAGKNIDMFWWSAINLGFQEQLPENVR